MDYIFVVVIYVSVMFIHSIAGFDNDFKPENIEQGQQAKSVKCSSNLSYNNNSGNFSFKDCGENDSKLNFISLVVSPDPIKLDRCENKNISLSGRYRVKANISENLPIEVDLRLRMRSPSGYMEICELIGEQYCHFDDVIEELHKHNITLLLTEGIYILPNPVIHLPTVPFILKGTFEASAFIKQEGRPLGCLFVQFCTTDCISY